MNFWAYTHDATGASKAEVARRTSIRKATVSEWDTKNIVPAVETALKVADTFGLSRAETLVAAGYLHPDDITTLHTATNAQLKNELARRKAQKDTP